MRTPLLILSAAALTAACSQLTKNEPYGVLAGAATGYIAAQALEINDEWVLATTLAGAAAGALVARNADLKQCAYATGDGRYVTSDCP